MASTFINVIGNALAEFDNNQQDDNYYEYLAWGALFNTNAWNQATGPNGYIDPFGEGEAIIIANNQEDNNGALAKGTPCH